MVPYKIKLDGPSATGTRVSAMLLHDLLGVMTEGSRRALRLRVDGRSVVPGTPPAWVNAAADFVFLPIEPGSTVLNVQAPRLYEAAPERFAQETWGLNSSTTGFELFVEGLEDALAGRDESDRYDDGLLKVVSRLGDVLERGIDVIDFMPAAHDNRAKARVTREGLARVLTLQSRMPKTRHVRVSGKLDEIRHSDCVFTLVLENGKAIRGVAEGAEAGRLGDLFGKSVVVTGDAVFRPSGQVLRIENAHVEIASAQDVAIWSAEPKPVAAAFDVRSLRKPQGSRSGLNAIFGKWPGEETDDDVAAALDALS